MVTLVGIPMAVLVLLYALVQCDVTLALREPGSPPPQEGAQP